MGRPSELSLEREDHFGGFLHSFSRSCTWFLSPQPLPGFVVPYWPLEALPLPGLPPFAAMTPPVPPAIRPSEQRATKRRVRKTPPFLGEDVARAIALVLMWSSSKADASGRCSRSRCATASRSSSHRLIPAPGSNLLMHHPHTNGAAGS